MLEAGSLFDLSCESPLYKQRFREVNMTKGSLEVAKQKHEPWSAHLQSLYFSLHVMHSHTICISYQKVNKQTNKPEKGCLKEWVSEAPWTKDHCHMLSFCCHWQNQSQAHYFLEATDADTATSQLLSLPHQIKMTEEVQEPEIGVYDFRDFFPWRGQSA